LILCKVCTCLMYFRVITQIHIIMHTISLVWKIFDLNTNNLCVSLVVSARWNYEKQQFDDRKKVYISKPYCNRKVSNIGGKHCNSLACCIFLFFDDIKSCRTIVKEQPKRYYSNYIYCSYIYYTLYLRIIPMRVQV